ncbi:MAG TPA: MlaD family protein, partial [Pusillimonas sp.]
PGKRYTLTASELGSLELGSPVYYRQIQVGRIVDYDLAPDGKKVNIQIFVDSPNDKFITADTRFWNASGVNLSLSADGFSVNTGSLASVIAGGIAFATPKKLGGEKTVPAKPNTEFALKATREAAMADPDGPAIEIDMEFRQSVRGLKVGAPIDFHGLELGTVADIDLEFNSQARHFYVLVKTKVYPMRFGTVYQKMLESNQQSSNAGHLPIGPLIEHGLRAQIRAANLLTGQQYIALDFFPKAEPVEFDETRLPIRIPTVAGNFDRLQQQVTSIVSKLDAIPYAGISRDLRASLEAITKLADGLNKTAGPQTVATLKAVRKSLNGLDKLLGSDSATGTNLAQTLDELGRAAKSLRALTDYLQAHPASLLRGHQADVLPPSH